MLKTQKGFTLIELLIVVAIIALLASIVLVGLGPARVAARDARRVADLHQLQNALEIYNNKCGYYPGSASCGGAVQQTVVDANAWTNTFAMLLKQSGVASIIPQDPSSGKTYYYISSQAMGTTPAGAGYILAALLEDNSNPNLANDVDQANMTANQQAMFPTLGQIPNSCNDPATYCVGVF